MNLKMEEIKKNNLLSLQNPNKKKLKLRIVNLRLRLVLKIF